MYEVPTVSASSFIQHFERLLAEANETDSIHDVTLQAGNSLFPAHKYILSVRSEFFRKQLLAEAAQQDDGEVRRSVDDVGCDLLVLENVSPEILEQALRFIYTDSCEMLVHGAKPAMPRLNQSAEQQQQQQLIHSLEEFSLGGRSALEVYRSLPPSSCGEGNKPKSKSTKTGKKGKGSGATEPSHNPVKMLQGVSKKLGLGSLSARWDFWYTVLNHLSTIFNKSFIYMVWFFLLMPRLDGVKYENGKINVVQKKTSNKPRFYQKKLWVM